jgi:hypothetical protein
MSTDEIQPNDRESDREAVYQIRVRGHLDKKWSEWFNGMTIITKSGITTLTGAVADQPKLRGILSKLWDLNLTLISVAQIGPAKKGHQKQRGERDGKTLENGMA